MWNSAVYWTILHLVALCVVGDCEPAKETNTSWTNVDPGDELTPVTTTASSTAAITSTSSSPTTTSVSENTLKVAEVTCPPHQFRCADGLSCIPRRWLCDNSPDCSDASDETPECALQDCKPGQFQCHHSRRCIPKSWLCDGDNDCGETGILESSDEDAQLCKKKFECPSNQIQCSDSRTCIPISSLCNNIDDCSNGFDEGLFCNTTNCTELNCSHGCKESPLGPMCFCEVGRRPNGTTCVDVDECEIDGKCDQICSNTIGGFNCSCVPGYLRINDTSCSAINVPDSEPPTLICSSTDNIRRIFVNGTLFPGNSTISKMQILALDFNHRNRSVCYIHQSSSSGTIFSCSSIRNFEESWDLSLPSLFSLSSTTHIKLDWISGNWYFVDDKREVIFLCNTTLKACTIVVEGDLTKPHGIALDPTKGYMFFTLWDTNSLPRLERSRLDGEDRTTLVHDKIVYPFGVTVDYPAQHVYWVDTYLDYVERINYDGTNRKTVKRGFLVQNLYDISVFENNLFMTSWHNDSIIRVNKFGAEDHESIPLSSRPFHIQVFHRQRQPDTPHPCHQYNGNCEHLCIPSWKQKIAYVQCLCQPGYRLSQDGRSCTRIKISQFLLYGKGRPAMIKGIPLTPVTSGEKEQVIVPVSNVSRPVALDYDVQTGYIYYSDSHRSLIGRQHVDGMDNEVVIKDVHICHGIAIDWAGRNLYWTDGGLSTINVVRLDDFTKRKILIQEDFMNPNSIVVDPLDGLMYWADWPIADDRTAKIVRAWMDGTHQVTFVSHHLKMPSGLTIDNGYKKLYWCDVEPSGIWSMTLDRRVLEVVVSDHALKHPFGLAVHGGALFWTDAQTGEVQRYDVLLRNFTTLAVESPPLYDLKVVDISSQNGTNRCSLNYGGCPDLCLASPNGTECVCHTGYEKNGSVCVVQPNFVPPSKCPSEQFQCAKSGRCIDQRYLCDGDDDCGDGSDEKEKCIKRKCKKDQFRCDTNRCISQTWVCDGDSDCGDGTDEVNCANSTCNSMQFTCTVSGHCIPKTWVCDHAHDCGEGDISDEGEICDYPKCDPEYFQCDNNRCVSFEFRCDSLDDCGDGSDEEGCPHSCKTYVELYCAAEEKCLPISMRCNGIRDCSDGTDEYICIANATRRLCGHHEFSCSSNGECIRKKFLCDGQNDCVDGSDELNCNVTTLSPVAEAILPKDCIHPSFLCDKNTTCLAVESLCDGKKDCADSSDERGQCEEKMCSYRTDCSHFCHDSPDGFVCWCPKDLYLQTDGLMCGVSHPCNTWGACSQKCEQVGKRHKCTCESGYVLQSDHFTCKSTDSATPYVIFSNRHELRSVDLHTFNVKALIMSLKNTIALDFFHTKNGTTIFWTDVIDDKIYRGTLISGSLSNIEVVVQTGLSTAEGLAVDWIGENLYWVESNLDQIEVARLDGKYRRTLIASDLESPRAIALDPRYGWLFWTDWDVNSPRIERCSMSGQYRKTVVQVDSLTEGAWPNGLTLDYDLRRIYWIDAKSDSIHTTTYNGEDHHEVMREHETLTHPFAIALFENYVYWTDWRTNAVIRGNKWNGSDISVIQRTLTQPFDIQIMHPSRQPKVPNPCAPNNGNCSHLCLLSINGTYRCDCPHVMRLRSDNRTCMVNEQVLLFSRTSEIRGVDLSMPYYHTIPTISVPQVLVPSQLDFVVANRSIYWIDFQIHEVKRSGLVGGPTQTIIDKGIEQPTGFAIDWISGNLFVSSASAVNNYITVSNLEGEYITPVVTEDVFHIQSLALNPLKGKLFWSHMSDSLYVIEQSNMDGSERQKLVNEREFRELSSPESLCMDLESGRLYWVNSESNSVIQYYDFLTKSVSSVPLPRGQKTAVVVYSGMVYYANQDDMAIHVANKTTGENDKVLRNNTGNVLSLKIYDPNVQTGTNPCSQNKGNCSHLCLPISESARVCKCALGYSVDPENPTKCIGIEEFLFYSMTSDIKGMLLTPETNYTDVLGPISRVSVATSIDFHAAEDYMYWADSDHGSITRIHRDGTGREVVVEHFESMDSIPIDWLTGLAVDWIAGNLYWTDPKYNVIEMSRLNGSSRYVVVAGDMDRPAAVVVDPKVGLIFWSDVGKQPRLERAHLDGSNRTVLVNDSSIHVNDIALDYKSHKLYWCDSNSNIIERINYDGTEREIVLEQSAENPYALSIYDDKIYWIDLTHERGSIKMARTSNVSDYTVLAKALGESLKDIQVFSKEKQQGSNPCAENNGGCSELCLFNGVESLCACAHGKVSADNKTCEDYDSFLVYSRVLRIDSIHMFNEFNLNAPFPSIQSSEYMRNAIGLSFDYKQKKIFYSDIQRGSINSVFFNGTNHTMIVERQGSVEGLAFEAVNNILYWTCNSDATINKVELATPKPTTSVVIKLHANDKPRGIDVDSCERRIYWTNWNSHTPSIQRAYTNGYDMESIITTEIRMPNALALDHKAQKLYWSDARFDKIERAEYDGSNRVILDKVKPQHAFDIAVYGDYIFWTDWVLHAVIRANKYTGDDVVWLRKDVPRPMGIIAVANDTNDCMTNPCLVLNGGCEDVCKLDERGDVVCSCFEQRKLVDLNRCVIESKTELNKDSSCQVENPFQCSNGGCIPFHLTCDGVPHCEDSSDESMEYCSIRKCLPGYFACLNGRCIFSNNTCNQINDCGDLSDEGENCTCSPDRYFKCASGACILAIFRCDNDPDCIDSSDEMGCPPQNCSRFNRFSSRIPVIPCNTTTNCIHVKWLCDGENDCWDGSDEADCKDSTTTAPSGCPENSFLCDNGQCISKFWVCDQEHDCDDGEDGLPSSDERNCEHSCRSDQFKCSSKDCIPANWQCDGMPDCPDSSDEKNCQERVCPDSDFRCNKTGRCIPWSWVCDGVPDCQDSSDELLQQDCPPINVPCSDTDFQCANGQCISKEYFCDSDNDCEDGSDEPKSCGHTCLSNEFRCSNGRCIPIAWKCNKNKDCDDGSDENQYMCVLGADNSTVCSSAGFYPCRNGLCINETLTCNSQDDCGDWSDEDLCNINECLDSVCVFDCEDLKIGYRCICPSGFKPKSHNTHHCTDIDECENRPCSQMCHNTNGSYVCSCFEGYALGRNKHSCKAVTDVEPKLIFSNRYYIRELDLTGHSNLLLHNLTNAVALDYDLMENCIYWSDVTALSSSIKCSCGVNNTLQVIHSSTLQNVDGLAVDWIGRNLYWCDKGRNTIEVSKLDGRFLKILINKDLQEPRALALDPREGYMYWTDWGDHPHIGKAGMDGSNPHVIVNESLGWPNAITISFETDELFWADAREDYIAVSDLLGKNVKIVLSRASNSKVKPHHIFAIAVFEDYLYWTDWETKSVARCHKYNGSDVKTLTTVIHRPMDIQVVHPYRQLNMTVNPCNNNGGCDTLCLLKPGGGHQCACPENYYLGADGVSCINNCTSAHFVCASTYKCIPFWWKCDTQDDCGDGSDEPKGCPKFGCLPGQFQCNNLVCIHPSQLCNKDQDCGDGSDEMDCNSYTCQSTQFKCEGNETSPGFCIPLSKKCDTEDDCPDGSDEVDCPPETCNPNQHLCDNKKCIPAVWVCDGDDDCGDNSEETDDCKTRTCPSDHFRCNTGRCIPSFWYCDGDADCSDNEDEPDTCTSAQHRTCDPTYFRCRNGNCIPGRWHCDYDDDCGDLSDEENCAPRNCSESEFRCDNGHCIRGNHQCDGEYNCEDHSDETNCNTTCGSNEFQCENPHHCIFIGWKCDGDIDCSDGSDELNCSDPCTEGQFMCQNRHCISPSWRCDGEDDCGDKSDEEKVICRQLRCPHGRHRCRNHICILPMNVCDGHDNCGDNSDEDAQACKLAGLCPHDEMPCANGQCINQKLLCDGQNDCGDDSDEQNCAPCKFGTCSHICVEKKAGNYSCHCAPGYSLAGGAKWSKNRTCTAQGSQAYLMVASDAELRVLNPYKPGEEGIPNRLLDKTPIISPGHKIESIDFLWSSQGSYIFWTDHQRRIQRMRLPYSVHSFQPTQHVDGPLVANLTDPRGLAIDWVTKRIYWVDAGSDTIKVSTTEGRSIVTLINKHLDQPHDIVVDPQSGLMFWTDLGAEPSIQVARMDGNDRHALVNSGVQWPTGLTMDYGGQRLYWTDTKAYTIESVRATYIGGDRQVVKRFSPEEKPYKLDVFEDTLYMTLHRTNTIARLNKFGRGNLTFLVSGLNRASDLLIVQENKQQQNLTDPCAASPCDKSALCVNRGTVSENNIKYSCLCPDGFVKSDTSNKETKEVICTVYRPKQCDLHCFVGYCKMTTDGPRCICPPLFDGNQCEHNRCSQYCKNKGLCFADLMAHIPGAPVPLKCNCHPLWTGDRCEIPVQRCKDLCYNNGTCVILKSNGNALCQCLSGFAGQRCQHCSNLTCENGGICSLVNGTSTCQCDQWYSGKRCETFSCPYNCVYGTCNMTQNGPSCLCFPGWTGKQCNVSSCSCLNGGICNPGPKGFTCKCPPRFTGRRCEKDLCPCLCPTSDPHCECVHSHLNCNDTYAQLCPKDMCLNGGTCAVVGSTSVCRCTRGWHGKHCQEHESCNNFCFNGGTCIETPDPDFKPSCMCLDGYTGLRCQTRFSIQERQASKVNNSSRTIITFIGVALLVLVLAVGGLALAYYVIRHRQNGKPFTHVRMQENVEISNPMYLREDIEEEVDGIDRNFTFDSDKSGNFANPVYESMYNTNLNDGVTSSEEKTGLLGVDSRLLSSDGHENH